ncbi:hypothetical protein MOF14_12290 [Bacillus spizizenii]|nr:hypothetical protein [Bacillus spizizenii]
MSLFGQGTFKQEVYDSLHYIIHNFDPEVLDVKEQLKFIHRNISYIMDGEHDKLNEWLIRYAKERNMTYGELCTELAQIYAVVIEYDVAFKLGEVGSNLI